MGKRTIIFIIFISFISAGCAFAQEPFGKAKEYNTKTPFVSGEIIVKFKSSHQLSAHSTAAMYSASGARSVKVKKLFKNSKSSNRAGQYMSAAAGNNGSDDIDGPGVYKLTYEGRDDIYTVIDELRMSPDVEYAEPNYLFQASLVPNDPSFSMQWGASKVGAPAAWDVMKGDPNIVIAVVDTGVDYNHPDLAPNIWMNTWEAYGQSGVDDDGNGYVDDIRGWDFVSVPSDWVAPGEDPWPPDNDPMDVLGHGTHVAGIAAGKPNNGMGIAGTAWNCKIMPLRAGYLCYDGGGYLELDDIAEAIYYAADNGANVINMSFGCMFASQLLDDAVDYAHGKGCVMVASAGNVMPGEAGQPFYPAACDHVIAVSSVDESDCISVWNLFVFSNFGDFVDLCAPGSSILSTLPCNGYGYANGTSMAAPFVSGAAALVKSKHMDWTPEQVEARLKETSDDIYTKNPQDFLQGKLGAGRLSAKKAMGNLSMAITYPRPTSILSGSTVVRGSANIEHFAGYKIEYCEYSSPDAWTLMKENKTQPIENGLLAIWEVSDPAKAYKIKLTVSNTSGESYSYISSVNFGSEGEVHLLEHPKCGPSPYDPNKGNFLFYYYLLSAADVDIYIYDISGTLVWQKTLSYDSGTGGGGGSAGPNRVFWDGVNGFGETIGNGAYIYMIIANDRGERKIIGRGKFAVLGS